MHVADGSVADEAEQPLQAVADDRRAQVTDMHWLGDVGAAEIQDHGLGRVGLCHAEARVLPLPVGLFGQIGVVEHQIDEAGPRDADFGQTVVASQAIHDRLRDFPRRPLGDAGSTHRAVALELAEVGAVAGRD